MPVLLARRSRGASRTLAGRVLPLPRLRAAALALTVIAAPCASAGADVLDRHVLTTWTGSDGLSGVPAVDITQDRDGYLWVGTGTGLLRFDGLKFERFRAADGSRLPQRSVSSLHAARDGSLWVGFGGGGGIYRIQDGRVRAYGPEDGLPEGRVAKLLEDVDGTLLAATQDGLYRLTRSRWARIGSELGLPEVQIFSLYQDRDGTLWVGTADAVFRRLRHASAFEPVEAALAGPPAFSQSPAGDLWLTDPVVGYRALHGAAPPPGDGRLGTGTSVLHDRSGNLWIATLGRGLWFRPRSADATARVEVLDSENGLSSDSVRCLFEDRDGGVWVGTTAGLHRFTPRRVTPVTDLDVVQTIEAGRGDDIWVGTTNGLVRLSNGERRWFGTAEGLPHSDIRALHLDRSGRLWIATRAGLALFEGDRIVRPRLDKGRWPAFPTVITTDRAGTLWICAQDQGLFRWRDGHVEAVDLAPGLGHRSVRSVATDSRNRIWFTLAGGGIGYLDDKGSFQLLRPGDQFHRGDLGVYQDDRGTVWFGGGDRLTRFASGQLAAITGADGLPAEAIRSVVGDDSGHLWLGTSTGIVRLSAAEFERVLHPHERGLEFRSYDASDGLVGTPAGTTGQRTAVRGADGRLWFVTANGLAVLDPRRLSDARPAPPVIIERVTANGRSYEPHGPLTLPPGTTSLQIDYTAITFSSPQQVQFQYRLQGLDDRWIAAGNGRQASFANLGPTTYRFHVLARSSEGVWNETGSTLTFSIEPTFYQTRWFQAACVGGAVGLLLVGWQLRLRQMRRRFALVLAERARMAREIHDTLLQSLAGLELQIDTMSTQLGPEPGPVKQQLDRVRRQIQQDVAEARQSIWDLRSPTLGARDLASALRELGEPITTPAGVRFECTVKGTAIRCAPRVEEHLLRVGREAISNAVRHGQARVITVDLTYDRDRVTLRVCDDGRGFDVTEAAPDGGHHWGLATMHERARAIGGRLDLVSRPGSGTQVEITAPLLAPTNT